MSRYIAIATIRIEHDYYNPSVNRFVSLQPTPETKELMKRRGVMFRAVSANEWQWIMLDDLPGFMDEDVLELSMIVKDPCFLQQIKNKGYDLGSLYKFNIENRVVEVNADYVWKKETNGQKLKDEFCRITLKLHRRNCECSGTRNSPSGLVHPLIIGNISVYSGMRMSCVEKSST